MRRKTSVEARFWSKVQKGDLCWTWIGGTFTEGYGAFSPAAGRRVRAHRYAYELVVGPIPEGLVLDHLCRNILCVNPAHLEPVTSGENVLRGEGPPAKRARQTHCKRGHPLSGPNLHIDNHGYRQCKACNHLRFRRWSAHRTHHRTTFLLERLKDAGALSPETAQPLGNVLPGEESPRHWSSTLRLLRRDGLVCSAPPAEPNRRWWTAERTEIGTGWYVVESD